MNHKTIKDNSIIEKYVLKHLSDEDELLFEEHLLGCDECFNEVQKVEKIISGINKVTSNKSFNKNRIKKGRPVNLFNLLNFFSNSRNFALAATILIIFLAYPAWQGIFTVSQLHNEIENLKAPRANIKTYFLQDTRAVQDILTIQIPTHEKERQFILNFNILEKSAQDSKYIAEIYDEHGHKIWYTDNLKGIGEYEVFSIMCRRSFFKEGEYLLKVKEVESDEGKILHISEFSFRIDIYKNNINQK